VEGSGGSILRAASWSPGPIRRRKSTPRSASRAATASSHGGFAPGTPTGVAMSSEGVGGRATGDAGTRATRTAAARCAGSVGGLAGRTARLVGFGRACRARGSAGLASFTRARTARARGEPFEPASVVARTSRFVRADLGTTAARTGSARTPATGGTSAASATAAAGGAEATGVGEAGGGGAGAGAGGTASGAGRAGRSVNGSRYPFGSSARRTPRWTYGTSTSASPDGPIVPTASPSATPSSAATAIEPRWSSVTA
jgi:hypothetical protein